MLLPIRSSRPVTTLQKLSSGERARIKSIEGRIARANERRLSTDLSLVTNTSDERYPQLDSHFCQAIARGEFGKVSLVVDFGIGAINQIGRREALYYSTAFIELATRLFPILGPQAKIVGLDCNSLVAEGNRDYVRSRPALRDRLRVFKGNCGDPLKRYGRESVDLIVARNVLGHYDLPERELARGLLAEALREGGHIIEGHDFINIVLRKTKGRLEPVELNILMAVCLGIPDKWSSFWGTTGFADFEEVRAVREVLERIFLLPKIEKGPKSRRDLSAGVAKYFQELKKSVPLATREQQVLVSLPLPVVLNPLAL